ncbi:MAG: hypothetical protein M3O26_16910, partial [Pseudomonadota bacterium]|nr:hypothetical protein [Pseudomonadota bacterium]
PGQPGQPGSAQRAARPQNAAQRTAGQGQQNSFARTPGQPSGGAARQAQARTYNPGQARPAPAKAANPGAQPKPRRTQPEAKKGER